MALTWSLGSTTPFRAKAPFDPLSNPLARTWMSRVVSWGAPEGSVEVTVGPLLARAMDGRSEPESVGAEHASASERIRRLDRRMGASPARGESGADRPSPWLTD